MLCVCKMLLSTLQYILSLIHNLLPPSLPLFCSSAPGLPKHVEGIIIGASVLAVILVVAFILLTVATGYYYYRKNKVVIVKVCVRRTPHMTCVSTCRCVSSVTRQSQKIQCSLFGRVIYCKYVCVWNDTCSHIQSESASYTVDAMYNSKASKLAANVVTFFSCVVGYISEQIY